MSHADSAHTTRAPIITGLCDAITETAAELDRLYPIFGAHIGRFGPRQKAAEASYRRVAAAQDAAVMALRKLRARNPAAMKAKAAALAVTIPRCSDGRIATSSPDGTAGAWAYLAASLARDVARLPG